MAARVKARGNFTDDMKWRDAALADAAITSNAGKECRLRAPNSVKVACDGKVVAVRTFEDGSLSFPTQVGQSYIVTLR